MNRSSTRCLACGFHTCAHRWLPLHRCIHAGCRLFGRPVAWKAA
jgi:hypothetical protein